MKSIYGDSSSLNGVNKYENMFNRVLVRDGLDYESEPLVSGYFFLSFSLPKFLSKPKLEYGSNIEYHNSNTLLNAVNTSITLPDFTISQVTIDGLGGTWNSVPGRLDVGKTFNVKFWETFSGEVVATHRSWLFQLRDPRSGASRLQGSSAPRGPKVDGYNQQKYKGQLWWWMTDPTIDRVIFAMEFLGIWPTNLPLSSISQDVATNDKVEVEITYAYDRPFFYPATATYVNNFLKVRFTEMMNIDTDVGNKAANGVDN